MKRRERAVPEPPATDDAVPFELLLGPCIEYWAPEHGAGVTEDQWMLTFRRYSAAVAEYLASIGVQPGDDFRLVPDALRRTRRSPWSIVHLARTNPQRLAERLERAGLPADWRPS